ncbi:MAG: zf-HC2 domain-containing protein [SAR202 cluster bacterium]|nr:zf-HC2 domain-containing protein [SAR202 cluster bacterium]
MKFMRLGHGEAHHLQCQQARQHLSELLEEKPQLTPALIKHIEDHLAECPPCQKFRETFLATVQALQAMPAQEVPARLRQALKSHVERFPSA